jgi:hypothetical protein
MTETSRCGSVLRLLVFLAPALGLASVAWPQETLELAGVWRFALDPNGVGERQRWFERDLAGQVRLPGALQAQGFGTGPRGIGRCLSGRGS